MFTRLFFIFLVISQITVSGQESFSYPPAKKVNECDTFFKQVVCDPYRWMEKIESEEVKEWISAEEKITDNFKIDRYSSLRDYLTEK